jgi:hypothetical protein
MREYAGKRMLVGTPRCGVRDRFRAFRTSRTARRAVPTNLIGGCGVGVAHPAPCKIGNSDPDQGCADHIRQMMGGDVHPRKCDEQRDREKSKADSPTGKRKRCEKCGRSRGVSGRKSVVTGVQSRAIPTGLGLNVRPSASSRDLDHSRGNARQRAGDQHRGEDSRPAFAPAPVRTAEKKESDGDMFGPVAKSADGLHKNPGTAALVLDHPGFHSGVEIKACWNQNRGRGEDHIPPAQSAGCAKFPFVFHPALSLNLRLATRNPQFRSGFPRRASA